MNMKWYHWIKLAGLIATAFSGRMTLVLLSIALHLLCDFTLQTEWMAGKASNGKALLWHSAIAGFVPLAIVGLVAGNPIMAAVGGMIGFITHYVIDSRNKFGLPLVAGVLVDQGLHIVVVVVFTVVVG